MTGDNAAYRQRQGDLGGLDHFPTCPRCGNLCGKLAVICADCHAPLKPTAGDLRDARENGKIHAMPPEGEEMHPLRERNP